MFPRLATECSSESPHQVEELYDLWSLFHFIFLFTSSTLYGIPPHNPPTPGLVPHAQFFSSFSNPTLLLLIMHILASSGRLPNSIQLIINYPYGSFMTGQPYATFSYYVFLSICWVLTHLLSPLLVQTIHNPQRSPGSRANWTCNHRIQDSGGASSG